MSWFQNWDPVTENLEEPVALDRDATFPKEQSVISHLFLPGKNAKLQTDDTDSVKDLPTVDSHYCRSTATYKDKKFLHPGTTIAQLHREYRQAAATAGVRAVGIKYFTEVFHEGKYSVFIPRKDKCDVCVFHSSTGISIRLNMMHM